MKQAFAVIQHRGGRAVSLLQQIRGRKALSLDFHGLKLSGRDMPRLSDQHVEPERKTKKDGLMNMIDAVVCDVLVLLASIVCLSKTPG